MNLGGFKIASSAEWEMQNLSGTRSTFGVPSCAPSFSWWLWKFTVTFMNTHTVTIIPGSCNQPPRNLGSHLQLGNLCKFSVTCQKLEQGLKSIPKYKSPEFSCIAKSLKLSRDLIYSGMWFHNWVENCQWKKTASRCCTNCIQHVHHADGSHWQILDCALWWTS